MKTMILASLILTSSISMAARKNVAACPAGTETVSRCISKPIKGDHVLASEVFDSIAICADGDKSILVFEKNGESESGEVKKTSRVGGVSYTADTGDGTIFSFSKATSVRPGSPKTARLYMTNEAIKETISANYVCGK